MNLPLFLARGVAKGGGQSISRTIIGIAVVAVAISMATMVLASALISGFKTEISVKIFGFWGHVHITEERAANDIMLTTEFPISTSQDFYPSLEDTGPITYRDFEDPFGNNSTEERTTEGGIRHIQQFILLPGIVSVFQEGERLADTEPLILKGIAEDFAWDDFNQYLIEGEQLQVTPDSTSRNILISNSTARRLKIGVGDRVDFVYFSGLREEKNRAFTVSGIYKTGLEEYDSKFALVDIKQLRRLLNWRDDEVGGFEVVLDDIDDLDAFSNYIHYDVLPQDLYADSIRNKLRELFKLAGYSGLQRHHYSYPGGSGGRDQHDDGPADPHPGADQHDRHPQGAGAGQLEYPQDIPLLCRIYRGRGPAARQPHRPRAGLAAEKRSASSSWTRKAITSPWRRSNWSGLPSSA